MNYSRLDVSPNSRDGFTEETLQKLDRKISMYFALIIVHLPVNK